MLIDAVVFGALGFLFGWLIKTYLLKAKGGLGTGGALGLCAVVWVVAVLVLATLLQGKPDYLMESLLDKAIAQQQQRDPSWVPTERQPVRHGSSSPMAGNAASLLAIGLFLGVKRRGKQTKDDVPVSIHKPSQQFHSAPDTPHPPTMRLNAVLNNYFTTQSEEFLYETAAKEIENGKASTGLMAKAFSDSEGDETKAKARYVKLRVDQLNKEYELIVYPHKWKPGAVALGMLGLGIFMAGNALFYVSFLSCISVVPVSWHSAIRIFQFCSGLLITILIGQKCVLLLSGYPLLVISHGTVRIDFPTRNVFQLDEIKMMRIVTKNDMEHLMITLKDGKEVGIPSLWASMSLEQLEQSIISRLKLFGVQGIEVN